MRIRRSFAICLGWAALAVACSKPGSGQPAVDRDTPVVVRGPYLQSMSSTAVTVRWRTDKLCRGTVRFQMDSPGRTGVNIEREKAETTEHEVRIDRLIPGTKYTYTVQAYNAPQVDAEGQPIKASFRLPPRPGTPAATRVWVLGGSGAGTPGSEVIGFSLAQFINMEAKAAAPDANPVALQLLRRTPDLWLMLGNLGGPHGTDADLQAALFNPYANLLQHACLYPVIGSQDVDGQAQLAEADALAKLPYYRAFTLPTAGECGGLRSGTEAWYAFDWANIHFICLDSQVSDRAAQGKMAAWLRQDLAARASEWTIVCFHHPPFDFTGGTGDAAALRSTEMGANILPILEQAGVDLVLCGHSPAYARTFPFTGPVQPLIQDRGDGDPDDPAPGGAYAKGQGLVCVMAGSPEATDAKPVTHPLVCRSLPGAGSLLLDVDERSLEVRSFDLLGQVSDRFVIEKK